MTAKTTRTTTTTEHTEGLPGQAAVTDLARQQLAAMADSTSAMFRASEVLQQVQQQAAQRAALMHHQAAEKLRGVSSPAELMAIQSGLMLTVVQETTQYWQELAAASMKLQAELMGRVGQQQGAGSNVAGAAMSPMLQAWQSMFSAPLNGTAGVAGTTH